MWVYSKDVSLHTRTLGQHCYGHSDRPHWHGACGLTWAHWLDNSPPEHPLEGEQWLSCLSLVSNFLPIPLLASSIFHYVLFLWVWVRFQAQKSDSCSPDPREPARQVLASSTVASYLISYPGSFYIHSCFFYKSEKKLTDRINFHCRFNSQLISPEPCTFTFYYY